MENYFFPESSPLIKKIIALALEEDLPQGDITAALTIPADRRSKGLIRAKESCVVCGIPLVEMILWEFGEKDFSVTPLVAEGEEIQASRASPVSLVQAEATTSTLLSVERTILNFMQRLCGVATLTRSVMKSAGNLKVLDTRKTTPGLRLLEKYAVRVGGGKNHRGSLSDMILVKNNHIDAGGGLENVLQRINDDKPAYTTVEVEVRSLTELQTALRFKPQVVMLDNMSDKDIKESVALVAAEGAGVAVEVSGGISVDRFSKLQELGIHCVSMGSLTTHAVNVDISMKIE